MLETKVNKSYKERFVRLSDLQYNDLVMLVKFLKDTSRGESNEEKIVDSIRRTDTFFPEITAVQEMFLQNIVREILDGKDDPKPFEEFKKRNPDIKVDREGRSFPEKKTYSGIRLSMLDEFYEKAIENFIESKGKDTSKNSLNTQIVEAKTLNLFKREPLPKEGYLITKTMFLKKFKRIQPGEIAACEKYSRELVGNVNLIHIFMKKFMNKKYDDGFYNMFQHILARLEIAYKEISENGKLTSKSSIQFIEDLKEIK